MVEEGTLPVVKILRDPNNPRAAKAAVGTEAAKATNLTRT